MYSFKNFPALGMLLCIGIVAYNLTVTKVLCRVHLSRRGSTSSQLHYSTINIKNVTRTLFHFTSKPNYLQTAPSSDEIRFAKLMLILSISFVLCWCPQMVSTQRKTQPYSFWFVTRIYNLRSEKKSYERPNYSSWVHLN